MSPLSTQTQRGSFFHRYWKPATITGAGGTAVVVWFDELLMFGEEILGLIVLPLLAGIIYLFDSLVFKSRVPRREDMKNVNKDRTHGK